MLLYVLSFNGDSACLLPLGNPDKNAVAFAFVSDERVVVLNEQSLSMYGTDCTK